MKIMSLFAIALAILFITTNATTTTTITLDPVECKEVLSHVWPQITPYSTFLKQPFENLKWFNITDTKITELTAKECKIYKRDIHGYRIVAKGIDTTMTAHFAYELEPGMPIVADKGSVSATINDGQLFARIDLLGEEARGHHHFDEVLKRFDLEGEDDSDSDSAEWVAEVATIIPKLTITTSDTDYASYYNKMLQDHNAEIKFLASLMANEQIGAWMEHYCNDQEPNHCEEHKGSFVEFMKKFTKNITTEEIPDHPPHEHNENHVPPKPLPVAH